MAHMVDGKGPYPDKAGEYCGNHIPGSTPLRAFDQTQAEANLHQKAWLSRMRFGAAGICAAGTSAEMAAKGWVGLYLKEDRELFDWETPVETDELSEQYVCTGTKP